MPLSDVWLAAALRVTGDFETSGDPWTAVTGDFDRMGISCGPLQWNIGQGSLQPLVTAVGRAVVLGAMPMFGGAFWSACQASIPAALSTVRSWQDGARLRPQPRAELKALLAAPEMRAAMLRGARRIGERAFAEAGDWDGAPDAPSGRAFCLFFDVITQNGGFAGIGREEVGRFIALHGAAKADDAVCDWLEDRSGATGHDRDARRNAALWRDATTAETLPLLLLAFLRAMKSKPEFQAVVLNRKGTVAMGEGFVNGERMELVEHFPN